MEYTIKLFYDGLNIQKYAQHKAIKGITTNCSLFSNNSIKNYNEFYHLNKEKIAEKPISFQIWEENTELAIQQINDIYAINPAVYIKIPIINTVGLYNTLLFEHAIKIGVNNFDVAPNYRNTRSELVLGRIFNKFKIFRYVK